MTQPMRNLRHRYPYSARLEFQETILRLRAYLLPLLMERQEGACALCKETADKYDIDHLAYNPMVTLNQLRALCIPCHHSITDYSHISTVTT